MSSTSMSSISMFSIFPNSQAIAEHLSAQLVSKIHNNPATILGLATGSTMEPIYARFVQKTRETRLDLSQVKTFNLDEYIGLTSEHPQSYYQFMQQHLFQAVGLRPEQVMLPRGTCSDLEQECARYSNEINAVGGLDIQLLGIGTNGHIGFNEPGTPFDSLTHVVELSENTRLDNGRFFDNQDEVPTHAITMGIQDIMNAKEIVLVATGSHKAEIMAQLCASDIDEQLPASILKQHPRINILVDEAAAALLPIQAKQAI